MEIVIILIVIVVILYLFKKNKQSKTQNTQRENLLVNEMEALIFYGKNSQQEINTLAAKILSICLKRANKRITLAEIIDPNTILRNPDVLDYIGVYKAIIESLEELPHLVGKFRLDTKKTAEQTLFQMIVTFSNDLLKFNDV